MDLDVSLAPMPDFLIDVSPEDVAVPPESIRIPLSSYPNDAHKVHLHCPVVYRFVCAQETT